MISLKGSQENTNKPTFTELETSILKLIWQNKCENSQENTKKKKIKKRKKRKKIDAGPSPRGLKFYEASRIKM